MLSIYLLYILLAFSWLHTLQSAQDGKDDQIAVEESKSSNRMKRFRLKNAGYDGKAMTSIRTAKRYIREGKFTDYHEALKHAEKDFTEKKREQKAREMAKKKALGIPRITKKRNYVRDQSKEHIITARVIKMVGRDTDLEKIKEAKAIVEAEFRRQKRVNAARAAHKKKALAETQKEKTYDEA
ncbi:uncharacterized protein FA14DRAFT_153814 [Meira miltonrushii]|uniref:Uncharacterized protein n=1 Tax=Meira miltonrushii TaxID=1280837 RepID=A0A316VQ08_9BASI|nr:uncharacterized protein FA14DRAFT_153814 [Meira miltonrushii]PWN38493.1 hypothetical protein FA14DRAFT_153814 [Meira miltonrushii]